MATTLRSIALLALVTLTVLGAGVAMAGDDDGTAATRLVGNEAELLLVLSSGLAGDAFGYDAGEIINQAVEIGMPVQDVLPTFYMAYLSGENYREVSTLRAAGASWGEVADKLRVSADALNSMAIPGDFEVTDPTKLDDGMYLALFTCSALAHVYGHEPDAVFDYYDAGWSPLDVMAAAAIAHRTRGDIDDHLRGAGRDLNWYAEARQAGMDLVQLTRDHGRTTENLVPMMEEEPRDADLETLYSVEMAADYWDVPIDYVRRARYRYLYSPSEVMVAFYLGNVARCDYYRIGRLYAHTHHRRWGPTIVALGIPTSHFSNLTIWSDGRVDFIAVEPLVLDRALLSVSLSFGCPYGWDYFYTRFDPWFTPCDAILYCGVHRRHPVYFDHYYDWVRHDRPRRHFPQFAEDYGRHRRSVDWVGSRRVGAITGNRHDSMGAPYPSPGGISREPRPGPGPAPSIHSGTLRTGSGHSRDTGFIRGRQDGGPSERSGNERFTIPTPSQPRTGGAIGHIQPPSGKPGPGSDRNRGGNERFTVPAPTQPRTGGGSVGYIQPPSGSIGSTPDRNRGGNERFTVPTPTQPRPGGGSVGYIQPSSPVTAPTPDRNRSGNEHFTVPPPRFSAPDTGAIAPRVDTPQRRPEVRHSLPPNYGAVGTPQVGPGPSINIGGRSQPPQMTQFGFGSPFNVPSNPTPRALPPQVTAGSAFIHGTGVRTGSGESRDDSHDRDRGQGGAIRGRRR